MVEYSAGIVTAYGSAKRAGYTGTYEDFCRQQAQYADNASAVEQAKQTAVSASQSADQAKQDAQTASTTAQQSAQSAQGSAQSAAQSAQDAQTAKSNAQTYAQSASQSAGSAQQSAQTAQAVLESIPEDYSDLSEDVDQLKADLETLIGGGAEQREIQFVYGSYINDGDAAEIGETVDITNLTNWYSMKHAIVECQEGDEFLIDMAGATNARAWAFLTSNNVLLSRSNANETVTGKITAPQNAGKVIIQGIYRQTQTDTSTDNGTAYKVIAGAGKGVVVRFDTTQNLTDAEKAQARENIGITSSSGDGLSYEAKSAILTCFDHIALWDDENREAHISALRNALFNVAYPGIVATYDNSYTVLVGNDVNVLKKYLTVKYYANASSSGETVSANDYTLTGTIAGSQNPITAIYNNFSSVFGVSAENYDNIRKIEYPNNTKLRSCLGTLSASADVQSGVYRRSLYVTDGISNAEMLYTSGGVIDSNGAYLIYVPSWATKVTVSIEPANFKVGFSVYNWYETSRNRTKQYGNPGGWIAGSDSITFEAGHRYFLGVCYMISDSANLTNVDVDNITITFE